MRRRVPAIFGMQSASHASAGDHIDTTVMIISDSRVSSSFFEGLSYSEEIRWVPGLHVSQVVPKTRYSCESSHWLAHVIRAVFVCTVAPSSFCYGYRCATISSLSSTPQPVCKLKTVSFDMQKVFLSVPPSSIRGSTHSSLAFRR